MESKTLIHNKNNGQTKLVETQKINKKFVENLFELDFSNETPVFQVLNHYDKSYVSFDIETWNLMDDKDLVDECGIRKIRFMGNECTQKPKLSVPKNVKKDVASLEFIDNIVIEDDCFFEICDVKTPQKMEVEFEKESLPLTAGTPEHVKTTPLKKSLYYQLRQTPVKYYGSCSSPSKSKQKNLFPKTQLSPVKTPRPSQSKAPNLSPSKTHKVKNSRDLLTNFSIPLSKFDKNEKLAKALRAKKFFERGPIGWMSTIILNELTEIGEDNPRGYECAGAFVFNNFRRYLKNARKDDPKEFIKYYKRSLETKKANNKKRSSTSIFTNDSTDTSEEKDAMVERYGFPNYVPSKVLDPNDFKDAIEEMKECNELYDAAKLKKLMAFTFSIRRQMVASRNFTTLDLITLMPSLFTSRQFSEEINRIVGFKVMTKELEDKLKEFCLDTLPDEISKVNNSKFKPALVELHKGSNSSNNIDRQRFMLMLGEIAILLQEDPNLIYGHEMSSIMSPYILMNSDSYRSTLMINGNVVLRDIRAIDMALIWCSSFPILNLEVPRRVKKTYLFLTKALLKWQPCGKGQPVSAMVSSLLNSFDKVPLEGDV